MYSAAVIFPLAVAFGLLFTWLGRWVACRLRFCDVPDGGRKTHPRPIPVSGGLGLLVAVPAALAVAGELMPEVTEAFAGCTNRLARVAVAAAMLAVVGVLDDLVHLCARHKLYGQLLAAAVLVAGDHRIVGLEVFGRVSPLDELAIPCSLVWLVFAMNAFNLLDGMDGMLGVVSGITMLGLAGLAAVHGSEAAALLAVAAVGGLVGFLRYNWPPATVYMGNAGSLIVGMTVAVLAMEAAPPGGAFPILAPLALLVLPLLDTTAAVVRRRLTGRPVVAGDREHLHHLLQRHGLSVPRVLRLVAALGAVAAGGAVLAAQWRCDGIAVGCALAVVATLLTSGLFGVAELRLVAALVGRPCRRSRRPVPVTSAPPPGCPR